MSFGHLAGRFAKELRKGDFIPSQPGALGNGYSVWARHPNGDVILHCGGNAGWFDWFRPVQAGDAPDFELTITDRQYRLVRGVDVIPAGFVIAETTRPAEGPRGRPGPKPVAPGAIPMAEPYVVEAFINSAWRVEGQHRNLSLALQDGNRYYRFNDVPFRVIHKGEVVYDWRPQPQGATV